MISDPLKFPSFRISHQRATENGWLITLFRNSHQRMTPEGHNRDLNLTF